MKARSIQLRRSPAGTLNHVSSRAREQVKDRRLARRVEKTEARESLAAEESRELMRTAIRERYTLPE